MDMKLLSSEDAETAVRLLAAFLAIVVSRIIIWGLGKVDFLKFFTSLKNGNGGATNLLMGMCSVGMMAALCVTQLSCSPGALGGATAYRVNTVPYSEQIGARPDAVVIDAEDVEPIGGFSFKAGAKVITDAGEFDISEAGVSGEVVIDLRSGK